MDNEEIHIALITDNNYFNPALVTIKSMLNHTDRNVHIRCIITEEINRNLDNIEVEFNNNFSNTNLEFVFFDDSVLKNVKTKWHVSRAAYVKIYLPEIFSDWNKCIFLDSDLLVRKDIGLLWDLEMNKEIGAVWNPGYDKDNLVIGNSMEEKTFNSGVLVMNLKSMRENERSMELETFIKEKNDLTHLNDQAAFNAVYINSWYSLPIEWNVQFLFYLRRSKMIGMNKADVKELINDPAIVHFTTSSKPWKFRSCHPYKKDYLSYYLNIQDANYEGNITLIDTIKRMREKFLLMISIY